jgi:hypothetical protein
MAVKKVAKKASRPKAGPKARPKTKPAPKLECRVCGYRVIVDETCGCVEEHVLVCCGQPMAKR